MLMWVSPPITVCTLTLVQWLKLVRTNHEVNVRVTDKIDLDGLPGECSLLVVSNLYDLLIVGSNNGQLSYCNTILADM
jgi:hypothetical protein